MPLATAIQSAGIAFFGALLDPLRAAQLAIALVAIAITPATYLLARRLGAGRELAALAAFVAGVGGVEAVAWSSLDNFAPLALLGTLLLASLPGMARGARRDIVVAGLGPIALVAAVRRADPIARGWLVVTAAIFLSQWLLFTLHSTRGSLAHSLAGIVPAAVVLALVAVEPWIVSTRRLAAGAAVMA